MIEFLVTLAVAVIVMALVWWVLQQIPLPEPVNKIVLIVFVVVCVIVLLMLLLSVTGVGLRPLLR